MIKVLKEMKKKFNKYWNKSHTTPCIPMVFDPSFKLKFVDFVFSKAFPKIGKEKIVRLEKLVSGLFSTYTSGNPMCEYTQQIPSVCSVNNDAWMEWYKKVSNDQTRRSTDLDRYLDEDPIQGEEFDIINWWMDNATKYQPFLI